MAVPPIPPPLEQLGRRPFSFFPPIVNVEHNQWLYLKATWSEVLVRNAKTNQELWISRRYVGEVSRVDDPVMIVGLSQELEYKAGAIWPARRRVIEIPRAVNESPRPANMDSSPQVAPVVGIRLENRAENRVGRLILGGIALGIAGCVFCVSLYRGGVLGNRVIYMPIVQSDLPFTSRDDYQAVLRAWGAPAEDRWQSPNGAAQYRVLSYPRQGYQVILMGRDRQSARYIGAMDRDWRPVHSVDLPGHVNSFPLLRHLHRF